jgi:predicted DsbA family dithiol-disulfide isomerase
MPSVSIDIVSDTICPWCYLGKRRLEAALALRPELDVQRRWHPYQLDPGIPREGVNHAQRLAAKFGSLVRLDAAHARLRELGKSVGIAFAFERIPRTPDTITTHCLTRWAFAQGGAALEDAMVGRLFRGFFEDGEDLTSVDVLVRLAAEVGLDAETTRDGLVSGADELKVRNEADGWRRAGIDAVPTFLFDGHWAVSGAQEVETFVQVLDRVAEGRSAGHGPARP